MEDRNAAKARYTIALIATSRMFKEGTIDADEKVRVPGGLCYAFRLRWVCRLLWV